MYYCPEFYGTHDYSNPVTEPQLAVCVGETRPKGPYTCDEAVYELCSLLMEENNRLPPSTAEEGVVLYNFLRQLILAELLF